jgi:hypothetical protein
VVVHQAGLVRRRHDPVGELDRPEVDWGEQHVSPAARTPSRRWRGPA